MIDLAMTLSMFPDATSTCRTVILSFTGGAGILSCDLLEINRINTAQLSEKTMDALGTVFLDWMPATNPVGLYPAMELHGRAPRYDQAITIVLEDATKALKSAG